MLAGELSKEVVGWQTDQDLFDEAAAALAGLNRTDFRCLDIVWQDGPLTAGELAAKARLTSGAVTAVLDRLEEAGYVRRVRDVADRRRVLVEFMPDLTERAQAGYGPLVADGEQLLARFSEDELEVIADFIRSNRELLRKHTGRLYEMLDRREESGRSA